jgi:indole-3-glycerol phosphate synthase
MTPLTEVHSRDDLEKAVASGAEIIGINNRDLDSFNVNIQTTFKLAPLVPHNCILVSESGITEKGDIRALQTTRIQAVLVGSALMRSKDPALKTKEIVNAGKMKDG